MKRLFLIPVLLCSQLVFAGLTLDPASSRLNFTSIKNNMVAEIHKFTTLSGSVSDEGELVIEVDLESVDTRIGIRDKRMKEFLFETEKFPLATYKAKVDMSQLKDMQAGEVQQQTVKGTIDLHGNEGSLEFLVRVVKNNSGALLVSTVEPAFISTEKFDMKEGVEKLQSLAGLKAIARAVPITFSVVFQEEETTDEPDKTKPGLPGLLPFGS